MGQAFRKLFDAFFGNKEMRVRYLLSSPLLSPFREDTAMNRGSTVNRSVRSHLRWRVVSRSYLLVS
jgi:hypothetical protein